MLTHTNLRIGRDNYNSPAPSNLLTRSCKETAALHEAGHAAKLIHAGLPLREVVISTAGGYVTCWLPQKTRQLEFITAVMCGSRAEQLLTGKSNKVHASGDLQIATKAANGDPSILEWCRVEAGRFVREHRKQIEVVAEKLLIHRTLVAREIRETFKQNTNKEVVGAGEPIFLPLSIVPEAMKPEQLLNSRRLPGRLISEAAMFLLGFQHHHAPILIKAGLLKPLGKPSENAVKYFATCEIQSFMEDAVWMNKASAAVQKHWGRRNKPQGKFDIRRKLTVMDEAKERGENLFRQEID